MDPLIRKALDDTGVSHYYGIRIIGSQVVILPVGGPAIYWSIKKGQVVDHTAPAILGPTIPAGDLKRFTVADLREIALAHSLSITASNRPKTKRHLIAELNNIRKQEE